MKLSHLGICGVISLLSYAVMVIFSPLAYPGYDWLSMAVSDLSAVGSSSRELAAQLNSLFGPCAVVSVMAVCVSIKNCREKLFRLGVYLFAVMEWLCTVGYSCFPLVSDADSGNFQNIMHIVVTVLVVLFSLASLIMIFSGTIKSDNKRIGVWALACLTAMITGAIGTNLFPKEVFGLFERFSTFSAVVFNAVLGWYLFTNKIVYQKGDIK